MNREEFIDDPVQIYLREVGMASLTPEEEADCVHQFRAGGAESERAGSRLMEANLSVVVSIAERYANGSVHALDLIIEGNAALMKALKAFRESDHNSFSAYAAPAVERAIAQASSSTRKD